MRVDEVELKVDLIAGWRMSMIECREFLTIVAAEI